MINNLLFISLAPVLIIGFYIYNRDKYEKEPFSVLMKALFAGVVIVLPVVLVEKFLDQLQPGARRAAVGCLCGICGSGFYRGGYEIPGILHILPDRQELQ